VFGRRLADEYHVDTLAGQGGKLLLKLI
jgi:hypothetical protein